MPQEIIDMGWEGYKKELEKDDFSFVDVGIISSDGAQKAGDSDLTLAQLASIQEFGVSITVTDKMRGFLGASGMHLKKSTKEIVIPPRPFIRGTFDEFMNEISKLLESEEKEILAGKKTRKQALTMIGQTHQNQIQSNMGKSGRFKANHPFTISRKKGSSQPLIDTGNLRQSINFEVG